VSLQNRTDYGIDAPKWPFFLGLVAVAMFVVAVVLAAVGAPLGWLAVAIGYFVIFALSTGSFLYTTRYGKARIWRELLAQAPLSGTETVLDLGCGRGLVLVTAAARVPSGRAVGLDLWRSVDQLGNDPARTLANAAAEGVTVELLTGDMRALPIADGAVDLVVSSLAIHNIPTASGREEAVKEAARVLAPGGRLLIADFRHTKEYAARLSDLGFTDVAVRDLGVRFWYGGPWGATSLVTALRS
jgi:arsenite methyltransferase